MKKYNVFKILFITFLVTMLASLFIQNCQIFYTGEIEKGVINPINFIDSVSNFLISFNECAEWVLYILCIGIFYAIIKKSGKYDDVVNNTACKFKNKKWAFPVISILSFGLLTAVIGDVMPLLVLVPAFIDVAKKLGYDSKKAVALTVGAIILGNAGSLNTVYSNKILQTTVTSNIIVKLVILVILLGSLIAYVLLLGEKPENVTLEENKVKKALPITIALYAILLLIIVGMTPWNSYFGFKGFSDFYKLITDFKVLDVAVFNAFLGSTLSAFGEWSTYNVTIVLIVVSVILALIYKLKVDGTLEAISEGIKKALPYALILIITNTISVGVLNSGFFNTIIVSLAKGKDYVLSTTAISALSSVLYSNYNYSAQISLSIISFIINDSKVYDLVAIIFQSIYSILLLIGPSSVLVLMALHREGLEYKTWIKYIYKYFLGLLIVLLTIAIIIGSKYVSITTFIVLAILLAILISFIMLEINQKKETKKVKKTTTKKVAKKNTTKKK